jgi:hypothetical protein
MNGRSLLIPDDTDQRQPAERPCKIYAMSSGSYVSIAVLTVY